MIAFVHGTVIDGTGDIPKTETNVLIEGSKIAGIGRDVPVPPNAQVVDATGKIVMPGLIDAHLHLFGFGRENFNDLAWLGTPLRMARAVAGVRSLLEAGYTSVRDAASDLAVSLMRAIDEGTIPGPRIVPANLFISQTGGHGDNDLPVPTGLKMLARFADGKDDCRKAVREQFRAGARVIKMATTGGTVAPAPLDIPFFTDEEIRAIVDEAHRLGLRVMCHAMGIEGIKSAIRNGVDEIEHATNIDDESVELMLKHRIMVVPTLAVFQTFVEEGRDVMPPFVINRMKSVIDTHIDSIKKIYRSGVKISAGSDFLGGITPHGQNAIELAMYVNDVGMSPMEALVATTKNASEALGLENEIGTLEIGKKADVILIDGNPLDDIAILQKKEKILLIMKDGKIVVNRRKEKIP